MQGLMRNYKEKYARFNTELQGKYWWHVMCCNATDYW